MSLKAKLEAVIYAADEPVTLAQLAALFAEDALAWKAEQVVAAAEAASADEELEAAEAAPLLHGGAEASIAEVVTEEVEIEAQPGQPETAAEVAVTEEAAVSPASAEADQQPEPSPEEEMTEATGEAPEADANPAEEEAANAEGEPDSETEGATAPEETEEAREKRLARQRDREARTILRQLLDELVAEYATDNRGVEIREIAGGYRMATKPEWHDAVRSFIKSLKPALKLSLPALETLAVVAYKQPVTAPEVNEIRGVDTSGVFGSLLARKLIATAGRKQVIGRPILYKTTKEFLLRFGLKDLNELPSMEEFEKLAASEFDEPEVASEAVPSASVPELDESPREDDTVDPSASSAEESETPTPQAPTAEPTAAE
jgi:segregation and condensation protein B